MTCEGGCGRVEIKLSHVAPGMRSAWRAQRLCSLCVSNDLFGRPMSFSTNTTSFDIRDCEEEDDGASAEQVVLFRGRIEAPERRLMRNLKKSQPNLHHNMHKLRTDNRRKTNNRIKLKVQKSARRRVQNVLLTGVPKPAVHCIEDGGGGGGGGDEAVSSADEFDSGENISFSEASTSIESVGSGSSSSEEEDEVETPEDARAEIAELAAFIGNNRAPENPTYHTVCNNCGDDFSTLSRDTDNLCPLCFLCGSDDGNDEQ